jgi:hypothetical protein
VANLDAFSLVACLGLDKPCVLLTVLLRHLFFGAMAAINLSPPSDKLELILLARDIHQERGGSSVKYGIITVDCLLTILVI